MEKRVPFCFWLPKAEAESFKKRLKAASGRAGRKIGVLEALLPAIRRFK